jgi:signal transduction histidine kinase
LGDESRDQLRLLMGRTERMQNLINGILEYSRIGRVHEDYGSIDLNELVAEILKDLVPPEHISFDVDERLPRIWGAPIRIRQLFQNLLSNAIKYMDKEHGCVQVGCEEEAGMWRFWVHDNGPGIEDKHFDRIFQIFQTLAPRDTVESTGIGLTVVKKIVERHGGRIWVQSKVGEGTTFHFTLPKRAEEAHHACDKTVAACRG